MTPFHPGPLRFHSTLKTHFDVFSGGADGLCALHQLRLVMPRDAVLVSGVERDVALLERVRHAKTGDSVSVFDVSIDANRQRLLELLARGVYLEYFDHHAAGGIPQSSRLTVTIDCSPDVCTSVLIDRTLQGRHRIWAVVGAFGDGLTDVATRLARPLEMADAQLKHLRELGEALSYNACGDTEDDAIVQPSALYRQLARYSDPFDFMLYEPLFARIGAARDDDLALARLEQADFTLAGANVYLLPNEPWSRRVREAFADDLAARKPELAHAVLTPNVQQGYTVSVRPPLARPTGADTLCRRFRTGGGRAAAAGIDQLSADEVPAFIGALDTAYAETQEV